MNSSALKLALVLLTVLTVVCFLPAHVNPAPVIARPALHWATAEERRESLEAMRLAWVNRDRSSCSGNGIEERRYIFRLNFFTRYVRDTETFHDASALLVSTYWDNAAVYGEINRH
jgi:hypothetical protein